MSTAVHDGAQKPLHTQKTLGTSEGPQIDQSIGTTPSAVRTLNRPNEAAVEQPSSGMLDHLQMAAQKAEGERSKASLVPASGKSLFDVDTKASTFNLEGLQLDDVTGQELSLCKDCKTGLKPMETSLSLYGAQRMFKRTLRFGKNDFYTSHARFTGLADAAANGCRVCYLMLKQIQLLETLADPIYGKQYSQYEKGGDIDILLGDRDYWAPGPKFVIAPTPSIDNDEPPTINRLPLGKTTGSVESFAMIRQWLTNCMQHASCRKRSTGYVPSRLIYVDPDPSAKVRLVLKSDVPKNARYVTLSHCWGLSKPYNLTLSNKFDCLKEIPFDSLSKTFQEAIAVTREVGESYIWIDSLCIIQDSVEDWIRQSALMEKVYSNSVCNISAAASTDGSGGLFRDHAVSSLQPFELRLPIKGTRSLSETQYTYCIPHLLSTWETEVEQSALGQRAWVCQERFLSPCNIHFGKSQIFWECPAQRSSEWFPQGLPSGLGEYDPTNVKKDIFHSLTPAAYGVGNIAPPTMDTWSTLLSRYSAGLLSHSGDKLIAFGGLASRWHEVTGDQYFAGLWKNHLPEFLAWHCAQAPKARPSESAYVAPSWSWAAFEGKVQCPYTYDLTATHVDIVDIQVEHATDNKYGQVKGGHIVLSGRLALLRGLQASNPGGKLIHFTAEVVLNDKKSASMKPLDCRCNYELDFGQKNTSHPVSDKDYRPSAIYLLPIFSNAGDIQGIMVQEHPERRGTFSRCGSFQSFELSSRDKSRLWKACEFVENSSWSKGLEPSSSAKERRHKITLI